MLQLPVAKSAKLLLVDPAVEQITKLIAVDLSGQTHRLRASALPLGWRQPALGIIIIGLIIAAGLRRTGQRRYRRHHQTGPRPLGGGGDDRPADSGAGKRGSAAGRERGGQDGWNR